MWQAAAVAQQAQPAAAAAAGTSTSGDASPTLQLQQVVVTGSLIAGTPSIGAPVTSLNPQSFLDTGALNVAEAMKAVPSVMLFPGINPNDANTDLANVQPINIHGLGSLETLLIVDGMRIPGQAKERFVSPDFINPIALEAVDVLPEGASATYGSDAVAGVVNMRLMQNYNGAKTQASYVTGNGFSQEQIGQLFGRQWDGGGIVLSYEYEHDSPLLTTARPGLFNYDATGVGGRNANLIGSSIPATLNTGKVSYGNGVGGPCSNCYAVPRGLGPDGVVNFSSLTPGTNNEVNTFDFGDVSPEEDSNGVTMAFHQDITPNIQFFSEDWYYKMESSTYYSSDTVTQKSNDISVPLPSTGYPYLEPGYPTNLTANLNSDEFLPFNVQGGEINSHFGGGLKFVLAGGWTGTVQFARTEDENIIDQAGAINDNNLEALLGETVTAKQPGAPGVVVTYTEPSTLGVYNIFCDPSKYSCLTPAQKAYISSFKDELTYSYLRELNATVNGPLFALPAGEVRLALGTDEQGQTYSDSVANNSTSASTQLAAEPSTAATTYAFEERSVASAFGQMNIPVVSPSMRVPAVRQFDIQASGRYDRYSDFGSTTNPKVAVNWTVVRGFILRSSFGTSFHAPPLVDEAQVNTTIAGLNGIGGSALATMPNCAPGASSPTPGSAGAAILAATGNTCASLPYSAGLNLRGVPEPGTVLGPETSRNWNVGAEFKPPQVPGLDVNLNYYNVKVSHVIGQVAASYELYDSSLTSLIGTVGQPNFESFVNQYLSNAGSQVPNTPANASQIQFLQYFGFENLGILEQNGLDFDARYTLPKDLAGTWDAGATGSYTFHQYYSPAPGLPLSDIAGTNGSGPEGVAPLNLYMRGFIGWTRKGLSITGYYNYQSGYTNVAANSFPAHVPHYGTIDLSAGYDFGDQFTSGLLQGLNVNLVVTNLTNHDPPLVVTPGDGTTFDPLYFNPTLRSINLTVTENW
jgi:iron complex outermembrane receptor protein